MDNNKVHIDDIDLKILTNFYYLKGNEQITTYQITKNIFADSISKEYDKIIKHNLITKKILRLSNYGLIIIKNEYDRNGKKIKSFNLIADKILVKRMDIRNIISENAMFLKLNGTWNAFVRNFFNNPKSIKNI